MLEYLSVFQLRDRSLYDQKPENINLKKKKKWYLIGSIFSVFQLLFGELYFLAQIQTSSAQQLFLWGPQLEAKPRSKSTVIGLDDNCMLTSRWSFPLTLSFQDVRKLSIPKKSMFYIYFQNWYQYSPLSVSRMIKLLAPSQLDHFFLFCHWMNH